MLRERLVTVGRVRALASALAACVLAAACGGGGVTDLGLSARPRSLRDVPAARLAFRFEPDVSEDALPERLKKDEAEEPLAAVRTAFETARPDDALMRTVLDPEGQRALALYGTSGTDNDFRIDLYSATGQFIRNILPADLTGVFPAEAAWSPGGTQILFAGIRNPAATASPTPFDAAPVPPDLSRPPESDPSAALPTPTPTAAPLIAPVAAFRTEQIYVGDRDGNNLRPLTKNEGLIYFKLAWSPDGQQIAALACREDEWLARRTEGKLPAGRPRIVTLDGVERLLDDRLTEVKPVWSPDGSKVATAFDYDVAVYDAASGAPTAGQMSVGEALRAASVEYDLRVSRKGGAQAEGAAPPPAQTDGVLLSFNPVVRLEWVEPATLLAQTAFVRFYSNDPLPTVKYTRWHVLRIYPQAAVLQ
ncbi:MAG TPA: hypothetical protein VD968_04620 [Pyrinomonadaceae bacterium]|nr:hypothetical protein [Pyrinomonadaceae bacterium]